MNPIISVAELAALVDTSPDLVLLDARPGPGLYAASHLRGARHADLDTELSAARDDNADPVRGGRHPLPDFDIWLQRLGKWGISPSTTVVVYDDANGGNAAARAWWMLRAVGHRDVAVLDGGWRELGVTDEEPQFLTLPRYPATSWQSPLADMDRVDALRNDPQWRVLDVRAQERYRGETEPIDPIAGRIPGAINLPFAENLEHGRFKSADALREQYETLFEGTPPERVVVHCGSGVTACHTLLALEQAGLGGAALYVGSWSEWCRNDKPQERG
ncbi:MAG TPA: sulfurtransferase [Thermoanaerobaculia bacterium]|nr:sulfurtransferase [Thermoanaerobaculia bacterium]